MNNEHKHFMRR